MKKEINHEYERSLALREEVKNNEPPLYQIVMHNDDYTPMEFVVDILEKFFFMDRRKATSTMLQVHISGQAVCGVYSRDYAETKVSQVVEYARRKEHPLNCSMEAA